MQFIFPEDYLNPNKVDEFFVPQAKELVSKKPPALFSLENNKVQGVVSGETVMYRGWMLTAEQYLSLSEKVEKAGAMLFTSLDQYLNTHHIPNWFRYLRDFTPDTVVFSNRWLETGDLKAIFERLADRGWKPFFLKDYVKSLKTATGSVCATPEAAMECVALMQQYRSGLEGGLCIRKYEPFFDEKRYFILNGKVPICRPQDEEILRQAAQRIDSPFFSVDVAKNDAGEPRVVEIGDGQVSDLVGWTVSEFAAMFKQVLA